MRMPIAAAVLLLAAGAASGQETAPPDMQAEPVAPGIWVIHANAGNVGVSAGPDGVFLIDDQYASLTPALVAALAKIHPSPPRFVVNTHWHGDHTGGNENLAAKGSVIVAHDRVRERMRSEQFNAFLERTTPPSPTGALPVVTFSDDLSLHVNGDELRGIHVPNAHTDGDVFIHFRKANVIHTGDLLFAGLYPFVDIDSGGSIAGVIAAVDRMLVLADDETRVIPGHGKMTNRAGLVAYRDMLAATRARMAELVAAGRTLDEILAEKPFASYDATLAWSFITAERYIRILYRDVTGRLN